MASGYSYKCSTCCIMQVRRIAYSKRMKALIIVVIGWACHLVVAQEKTCSAFCTSLGMLQSSPGKSCDDIYQINKASRGVSGNYWVNTTIGAQEVYCNMELECGGHKGGWLRIADINPSRGDECPTGWSKSTTPVAVCKALNSAPGCYSTHFSTLSIPYGKVCGMAVGYETQGGGPDGFLSSLDPNKQSINDPYVDGVSITYGTPRKHLWTFAIGWTDSGNNDRYNCPCSQFPGKTPPSFVHHNYYCESGIQPGSSPVGGVYSDDPLWDGEGCTSKNSCCSEPNQPWFYRPGALDRYRRH